VLVTLAVATIVDLLLAVFLIAISGLIFGPGPESANGEPTAAAIWIAGLVFCLVAPLAGFIARRRGLAGWGVVIACTPLAVGLGFLVI
jgi:hypothetical protein